MHRSHAPRGYVLMVVVVLGVVLASLGAILLYATGRDRSEASQQQASIRAIYAAESAVAVGVEHLRELLEENTAPVAADLDNVEARTKATLSTTLADATFPVLSVKYYNPVTNEVSDIPIPSASLLQPITEGPNKGLQAQQTPIQVLATGRVNNASSTVADAVRIDLIPVFQFAIFFDGDLETLEPATMGVNGRVHANGDIWLSNAASVVTFNDSVTSARRINSRSAFSSAVKVATNKTLAKNKSNVLTGFPIDLPKATDAAQKTAIETVFGEFLTGGKVGDQTTGVEPLSIPIRLASSTSCAATAACGPGRSCMKVRATDPLGVCTDNIVSRPSLCSTAAAAEFGQSLAVELIKRPAPAYGSVGVSAPYADGGVTTNPYFSDFGPRSAVTRPAAALTTFQVSPTSPEVDDRFEVSLARSIPHVRTTTADDDPGTVVDRMYWKADIRIIDGVWYKKGSTVPVFDPELVGYPSGVAATFIDDVEHKFARVLRYSWWWDAREGRVYCEGSDATCVPAADGKEFHRGQQIRASDFDMFAFMVLLEDATARTRLFPGGTVPTDGVIVYMSETYDARYEDANSKLPRAANVRNFLNFPVMHNDLTVAQTRTPASPVPARQSVLKTPTGATPATPTVIPTPYELGWFPENLWGVNAPVNFNSLTPVTTPITATTYGAPTVADPASAAGNCLPTRNAAQLATARIPARPASFSSASFRAPCIQADVTPMGPENAVRLVRAQSVPLQGFTFVTDNRLYVHGNVNVASGSLDATTKQDVKGKVALMADAITLLSERFDERDRQGRRFLGFHSTPTTFDATVIPAWTASNNGASPNIGDAPDMCAAAVGGTVALDSKYNTSLLTGDVPSCFDAGNSNGNRSGGVNNFPRFAEAWATKANVITGSMVGLFRSEQGNSRFINEGFTAPSSVFPAPRSGSAYSTDDGCYYSAPNRTWSFDTELLAGIDKLPPGTPRVVATDRLRWVRR